MIARIFFLLILLILIPDLYLYKHYVIRKKLSLGKRFLWWLPSLILIVFTIGLSTVKAFIPDTIEIISVYLLLLGVIVIPKAVYSICSALGLGYCRMIHSRKNYGNLIGFFLALFTIYMAFYSFLIGPHRFTVRQEEFVSKELPQSFDGYRIVQFTDAHVGSLPVDLLKKAVDSINAQKPDMIVFTGDLQNLQPDELDPVMPILKELKAKDGVVSILGNHDYAFYLNTDFATAALNEAKMKQKQHDMGWKLLLNENFTVKRGGERIFIAGMENESQKAEQTRSDLQKTMAGVPDDAFVIMLQHEPTAWRRTILSKTKAQLTLSGHTHGGQFKLFGWTPVSLTTDEWGGHYQENKRALLVSTGLGGLVPFRFGVIPEIVVITLRNS
jgi:hypothetical protein